MKLLKCLLPLIALTSSSQAFGAVSWADMTPWNGQTTNSGPKVISITGGGTFALDIQYVGNSAPVTAIRSDLAQHGKAQSGLVYNNNLSVVALFASPSGPAQGIYTITLNTISLGTLSGVLYLEGLNNFVSSPNPNPMSFTATGGGLVANWIQIGSFAPRGNNDVNPLFNPATGTLSPTDSGLIGQGDSSGIFIDLGAFNQYSSITMSFTTDVRDGWQLGVGAVPEPTSVMLGFSGLLFFFRRKR